MQRAIIPGHFENPGRTDEVGKVHLHGLEEMGMNRLDMNYLKLHLNIYNYI